MYPLMMLNTWNMFNPTGLGVGNFLIGFANGLRKTFGAEKANDQTQKRPQTGFYNPFGFSFFQTPMTFMPAIPVISTPFVSNFNSIFNGSKNYFSSPSTQPLMFTSSPSTFTPITLSSVSKSKTGTSVQPKGKYRTVRLNGDLYGKKFLDKVKSIAKEINCDYQDLLAVMNSESGFRTDKPNPYSGAIGLIQFMPSTAKELGTSISQLAKMTPMQQLDYVKKYYLYWRKANRYDKSYKLNAKELYALTFYPAAVKPGKDLIVTRAQNPAVWTQNPTLDVNKNNKITKTELWYFMKDKYVTDESFTA